MNINIDIGMNINIDIGMDMDTDTDMNMGIIPNTPLIVDLDGTLLQSDMISESVIKVLHKNPTYLLYIPFWLLRGKAAFKQHLAQLANVDPSVLPYNQEILAWLRQQRDLGRRLILCTASDKFIADKIATYLGIFDDVMASDGIVNLSGEHKAAALVQRFGEKGFDYIGNACIDLAVWKRARRAIVVTAKAALIKKAGACCEIERIFPLPAFEWKTGYQVLRVHQWLKNSLLFVPLLAAHQFTHVSSWLTLILAFFAFGFCASSVYVVNDLLDLESDRQHPRKCKRPFVAGSVPLWIGVILTPLLLMISLVLAEGIGITFSLWLLLYFGLTCAYSCGLKRLILVDCLILAMLYTLRIVAGASALDLKLSFWLLAFSVFLFFSLAFIKRYAELQTQLLHGKHKVHGRGYYSSDAPLIQMLGIASGYASVLVLALYLNSDAVSYLYHTPAIVWGAVPIVLFWISWMWMQAHRGNMHDDPVLFALQDKVSLIAGAAFAAVLILATIGWPW